MPTEQYIYNKNPELMSKLEEKSRPEDFGKMLCNYFNNTKKEPAQWEPWIEERNTK